MSKIDRENFVIFILKTTDKNEFVLDVVLCLRKLPFLTYKL